MESITSSNYEFRHDGRRRSAPLPQNFKLCFIVLDTTESRGIDICYQMTPMKSVALTNCITFIVVFSAETLSSQSHRDQPISWTSEQVQVVGQSRLPINTKTPMFSESTCLPLLHPMKYQKIVNLL